MKIFITGITSFVGKSFLPKLLNRLSSDDVVFALVRERQKINDNRVNQLIGDLHNIELFEKELSNSNYIYHIAANAVFGSDADYYADNFIPTKKMVDIIKKSSNLKNFIYISSIGAFDRSKDDLCDKPLTDKSLPNPRSDYGRSKLESERYIKNSNIPYTIIRPTWIYGKDMRSNSHINKFVEIVLNNSKIIKFNFPGKVSVIHVDDLAESLANVLNNDKIIRKTYFASSEHISIGSIFKLIYEKIYAKELKQVNIPRLSFIFSRIHNKIPVSIANLFLDYLCAYDENFWEDFNVKSKKLIEEGILDVINTNVKVIGSYVITGANSGIGYELAKILDNQGKRLILIDKNIEKLTKFDKHKVIECDLADFVNSTDILDSIKEEKIYCLINNAGIGLKGSLDKLKEDDIKKIVYINALAPILLTKKLLNILIKNEGIIVNIISNIAFNPLPNMSLYSATKAFLYNWSASLSYELRKTNTVITFAPSGTFTNFQKSCGVKILKEGKGLLKPEYVAEKIIEAINKRKKFVILGFSTKILLLISKFLPFSLNIKLWGKLLEKFR